MGSIAITTNEKQILAICLQDKQYISKIDQNYFLSDIGQVMYKAFNKMIEKEVEFTNTNIIIFANNDIVDANTIEMLRGIECEIANFDTYYEELRKMKAHDNNRQVSERLFKVSQGKTSLNIKEMKELRDSLDEGIRTVEGKKSKLLTLGEMYANLETNIENKLDGESKVSTGCPYLDKYLTLGLAYQSLSVLAGASGSGKSGFAQKLFKGLTNTQSPVLYVNLELNEENQALRNFQSNQHIKGSDLIFDDSFDSDYVFHKLEKEKMRVSKHKRSLICFEDSVSLQDLEVMIEEAKDFMKVDGIVVIVDLIDLVSDWGNSAMDMLDSVNRLHRIVRKTNSHVMCLVQINRSAENNKILEPDDIDKFLKPKLSSLYGSGAYEQRARTVLLLYRKKHFMKKYFGDTHAEEIANMDDIAELSIAKQTQGDLARLYYLFEPETYNWYRYNKEKVLLKKADMIKEQNKIE